jgi:transposase-like protein
MEVRNVRNWKDLPRGVQAGSRAVVEKIGNRSQVARELGIDLSLLKLWRKKINANPARPFPGEGNPQEAGSGKRVAWRNEFTECGGRYVGKSQKPV